MSELKVPVNIGDHHQGNIEAKLTLVEYGDFQCPYCGRAHPLVKQLLREWGHDLHFVFRHFPLAKIHPLALACSITAEAAGQQGKFWEMHDLIFENQRKITTRFLTSLAEGIGLDMIQFDADIKSDSIITKVEHDFESGIRNGVNGTPTFFLNGSPIRTYDETYSSLTEAIQQEAKFMT